MTTDAGVLRSPQEAQIALSRVLILGGGFGGIYAAIELERALRARRDVSITLVTRDNYFLFTPMLHEVAASDLEMNTIVNPLRKMLRRVKTFTGNIETINLERRCVAVTHGFDRHVHELAYDHLIIALGSSTNFFGLPGVQDDGADYQNARRRDRIEEPTDHASRGSELGVRGRPASAAAHVCGSGRRFRGSRNAGRNQ